MQILFDKRHWPALAAGGALAAGVASIAASQTLLAVAILLTVRGWRDAKYPKGVWLLTVFFALTLVAALFSAQPAAAWPQIRKFYVFLIIPCIASVAGYTGFAARVLAALGGLGTLSALWGLAQYAKKYNAAKVAGVSFTQSYIGDRITGFMSHWMTFGGTMTAVLLIAAAYLLFAQNVQWRVAIAALIVALAIFLGWTRGVWIGAFAGFVYLLWFRRRALVLAAPLLAIAAVAVMPAPERSRALSIFMPRGEMDSNSHRKALARTGWEMIKAHPLLGVGPEQVERNFDHYAPADIPRPFPREWWYGHLHNIYIQYSADRGVPAMLAFAAFLIFSIVGLIRKAGRATSDIKWIFHGIGAFLAAILVTGLFEHNLADSEILMLTLGLLTLGLRTEAETDRIGV